MIWSFSNRRRAKEAVTVIRERYGFDDMAIMVTSDMVYVEVHNVPAGIDPVMHFGTICLENDLTELQCDTQEVYRGEGTAKFRL